MMKFRIHYTPPGSNIKDSFLIQGSDIKDVREKVIIFF